MYIFYFEFFDDFQKDNKRKFKIIKKSKTKMYLLPTNHVISTKKFQSKILCILSVAKKTNLVKFWNRLMEAVGWRVVGGWEIQLRRASH
jgi:hypothetical protein